MEPTKFFSHLALLVQLDLGTGVRASLLQTAAQVLDVSGEDGPVLLSLGPVSSLNDQLLVELLHPALELLHLFGVTMIFWTNSGFAGPVWCT